MGYVPHENVLKRIKLRAIGLLQDAIIKVALVVCRWSDPKPEAADQADRIKKELAATPPGTPASPSKHDHGPVLLGPAAAASSHILVTRSSLAAVFKAGAAKESEMGGRSKPFMDGLTHGLRSAEVLLDELARRMGQAVSKV